MPEWNADLRSDELTAAGCRKVHVDHAFSTLDRRPQLDRLLEGLPRGDALVVWRWAPWDGRCGISSTRL